jgi:hypothetical protein
MMAKLLPGRSNVAADESRTVLAPKKRTPRKWWLQFLRRAWKNVVSGLLC